VGGLRRLNLLCQISAPFDQDEKETAARTASACDFVRTLAHNARHLTDLDLWMLNDDAPLDEASLLILARLPDLTTLKLMAHAAPGACGRAFAQSSALAHLQLNVYCLSSGDQTSDVQALAPLPSLQSLHLRADTSVVSACRSLVSLTLVDVEGDLAPLSALTHLQELNLQGVSVVVNMVWSTRAQTNPLDLKTAGLGTALQSMRELRTLSLFIFRLTRPILDIILHQVPLLSSLRLRSCELTPDACTLLLHDHTPLYELCVEL
jgi:hypothetical protein